MQSKIAAGGGTPPTPLTPRERYEHDAEVWVAAGCPADLLETSTLRLVALRCWFYSDGCLKEYEIKRLSDTVLAYLNACLKAQWDLNPDWYEQALRERTHCEMCGERYMLDNLSICTDCLSVYCFNCVTHFPRAATGNRTHECRLPGSGGGELVG